MSDQAKEVVKKKVTQAGATIGGAAAAAAAAAGGAASAGAYNIAMATALGTAPWFFGAGSPAAALVAGSANSSRMGVTSS